MEKILHQLHLFLSKHSETEQDLKHSAYLEQLFGKQSCISNNVLIIDCHTYRKEDLYWILEFIRLACPTVRAIEFITGAGNHCKKPIMDYYTSLLWRPPLYIYILKYFQGHGLGARIDASHAKIYYRPI